MGVRTGKPRGRPKGSKSKRTIELEQAVKAASEAIGDVIPNAFDGDAHAFLMTIYRDPQRDVALRIDAAKAAVRYEKPALAAIDVSSENVNLNYDVTDEPLSEDEWAEEHPTAH